MDPKAQALLISRSLQDIQALRRGDVWSGPEMEEATDRFVSLTSDAVSAGYEVKLLPLPERDVEIQIVRNMGHCRPRAILRFSGRRYLTVLEEHCDLGDYGEVELAEMPPDD